jgi:predicted ribosomally synthesized peptide with SipW-like signal peptide
MKKKILTLCLCVILCSASVVFGTLAYFTDTEFANVSTITMGGVQIEWTNPDNDDAVKNLFSGVLIPGATEEIDISVKNTGSVDAYLRVNVGFDTENAAQNFAVYFDGQKADSYKQKTIKVGDKTETLYFYTFLVESPLNHGESWTDSQFKMVFSGNVKNNQFTDDIHIHFLAEAIQKTGFDNATAAFNAFDGKTN